MAKEASFDIVSEFDRQELVNAVDQTKREILTRFDLKDSKSTLEFEGDKSLILTSADDMKLKNILDILYSKMTKRNLNVKILNPKKVESSLGGNVKQEIELRSGIDQDKAKKVIAEVKASKLKVQASIRGDLIRVVGKNKDDLQAVIQLLREKEDALDIPLQFINYR